MHPFLFGFWVCFGPQLVLLFILSWSSELQDSGYLGGSFFFWLYVAMIVLPALGLALIIFLTKGQMGYEFRGRSGIKQLRGALIGTIGSYLLLACVVYAEELRETTKIDALKSADPEEFEPAPLYTR